MESSAKDVPLQETLRKVLNFTSKGWDAAKAHALRAVETDNKMRVWLSDDTHTQGLLFQCHLGRINIDSPIGMLPVSVCVPADDALNTFSINSVLKRAAMVFPDLNSQLLLLCKPLLDLLICHMQQRNWTTI